MYSRADQLIESVSDILYVLTKKNRGEHFI